MKQRLSLLLVFALVLSLFAGCGSQGTPEPHPATPTATETPAATVAPEEPEETFADGYDWVPEALRRGPEETMHWEEMLELLGSAIAYCDADAVGRWKEVLTPKTVALYQGR